MICERTQAALGVDEISSFVLLLLFSSRRPPTQTQKSAHVPPATTMTMTVSNRVIMLLLSGWLPRCQGSTLDVRDLGREVAVSWSDCGGADVAKISQVAISPTPLMLGQEMNIDIQGTLPGGVEIPVDSTLTISGKEGWFASFSHTFELCSDQDFSFPMNLGDFHLKGLRCGSSSATGTSLELKLAAMVGEGIAVMASKGTVWMKPRLGSGAGQKELACLQFEVTLKDPDHGREHDAAYYVPKTMPPPYYPGAIRDLIVRQKFFVGKEADLGLRFLRRLPKFVGPAKMMEKCDVFSEVADCCRTATGLSLQPKSLHEKLAVYSGEPEWNVMRVPVPQEGLSGAETWRLVMNKAQKQLRVTILGEPVEKSPAFQHGSADEEGGVLVRLFDQFVGPDSLVSLLGSLGGLRILPDGDAVEVLLSRYWLLKNVYVKVSRGTTSGEQDVCAVGTLDIIDTTEEGKTKEEESLHRTANTEVWI